MSQPTSAASNCQVHSKYVSTLSTDPADLFTQLYDDLDRRMEAPLQPSVAMEWLTDELVEEVASWIEGSAVIEGQLDPEGISHSIEQVEDPDEPEEAERRIFAILCGLDRAFAHINPHTATYDQGALRHLAVRYAERGRFNSPATRGALLPRYAFPGRLVVVPESLSEFFTSVVRVPPPAWAFARHAVIPNRSDFGRLDRQRGLRVGCAPVMSGLDDVDAELSQPESHRLYTIRPRPDRVRHRIVEIIRRLDESGAALGVMPELALANELLQEWRVAAVENPPGRTSRLKWIFAGTGPVGDENPPTNRGVLIDRRPATSFWSKTSCSLSPSTRDNSRSGVSSPCSAPRPAVN
jgi:hypothetical protein